MSSPLSIERSAVLQNHYFHSLVFPSYHFGSCPLLQAFHCIIPAKSTPFRTSMGEPRLVMDRHAVDVGGTSFDAPCKLKASAEVFSEDC